jgi:hypothetical protein
MTAKKSERGRVTHRLESAEGEVSLDTKKQRTAEWHLPTEGADGGTSQSCETKRGGKGDSHPGERRGKDKSE